MRLLLMCVRKTSHVNFPTGKRRTQHERVGAKNLRKIELSKNFSGISEPDDFQDIPKDDDMIVFE